MDATGDGECTADSPGGQSVAPAATLSVSVRDAGGAAVLGNVFITVTPASGGGAHRELRYDARRGRYLFPRLRADEYRCSITAAGYEPETRAVRLDGAPAHLEVQLRRRSARTPLLIQLGAEWDAADAAASAIWSQPAAAPLENMSLETGLLVAFLRDRQILDVLSAPIDALDLPADLVPYLRAQISGTWTFLVGAQAAAALVTQLAESRARLYAMTRGVFRNRAVREAAGHLSEPDLHAAALELIRSLDSTELMEILPLLMRSTHPERIPVAYFVRAAADLFGAQLPPRVARRRGTAASTPSPPSLPGDAPSGRQPTTDSTLDDAATAHSPRIAALARAAAWAVRHGRGLR